MEQCPFEDCRGKISSRTSILVEYCLKCDDIIMLIKADLVIAAVRIAFAGHSHVFHAVWDTFSRALQQISNHCRHGSPGRSLVFLATETAAKPGYIHFYFIHANTQYACHGTLHLGRALCRRIDLYTIVFCRIGISSMCFQVKLFLPSRFGASFKNIFAVFKSPLHVSFYKPTGRA